ncbi:hypothetical protein OPQ81_011989 [Rhizoctonia solani]|nr:hypothetical protein OPQ81_011989 [Rhizoctonia solani]
MPRRVKQDTSGEVVLVKLLQEHLIGTFTVFVSQTKNHSDQRALDQTWVDQLVGEIGAPGILNRAKHPIDVILEDETWETELSSLLDNTGKDSAPILPDEAKVVVFAGQHCLAMLSQLSLGADELWWHANIYRKSLEVKHPAEFITMMHDSNSPQVVKTSSDVDLIRAVVKLKGLLKSGIISEQTFLNNRHALLSRCEEQTQRAMCNLTRNESLMDAIMQALSRAHIASAFSPGSWMRLTTGRFYMVATGLVWEMTKQVDLLTKGMAEVPKEVLLRAGACDVSKIKAHKHKHAWDVLPGGKRAALKRVLARPKDFVTPLNPKGDNPWTLPDIVLLPSCFGAKIVEDKLKQMQKVTNHILKMILVEANFEQYCKATPETMEMPMNHPEGILGCFIQEKHPDDPNVHQYEQKVLQRIWVNRAKLDEDLAKLNIPGIESAAQVDYQRLIDKSQAWWGIMRLFKVPKI